MAIKRFALVSVLILLSLGASDASGRRMPPGSFLLKPAYSVAQLTAQVNNQPLVASRYEKHFGVTAQQFTRYAQSHLGLRRLPRAGRYRVYYIKPDGTIGSQVRYLRKGTRVFLHLRFGQPVLLGECGNPMQAALPGWVPPHATVLPPRVTAPPVTPKSEPPLPEPPIQTIAYDMPAVEAPVPLEPVSLTHWQADPILKAYEPMPPISAPAWKAQRPYLLPMALFALLGAVGTLETSSRPPAVIPEPATLGVLAGAAGVLLLLDRRRRTRG